jgi:hypothetical protein
MGFYGEIMNGVGDMAKGIFGARAGKRAREDAWTNNKNYYADLDLSREVAARNKYDPTYQSQLIGPYQRSQSPAARAYLESMLTGDNSQAAAAPWADQSQQAQAGFDKRYGNYDKLLGDGRNGRASTPWKTKQPGATDTSVLRDLADMDSGFGRGNRYESNRRHGERNDWEPGDY